MIVTPVETHTSAVGLLERGEERKKQKAINNPCFVVEEGRITVEGTQPKVFAETK